MSSTGSWGGRLYRGEKAYDFVGHRKRWYLISVALIALSLAAIIFRGGLNLGVEFTGGAVFTVPTASGTVQDARDAVAAAGVAEEPIVTEADGGSAGRSIRVQTVSLSPQETEQVSLALADALDAELDTISSQIVGPSWGAEITRKAVTGLAVFLTLIVIYLSIFFEWKMAVAALVALVHDVILTVGVYALTGFEVTPATVIGFLTILGYSLYDTVVVFDKVKENTRGITSGSRRTYSQAANLAVNQTLVRSLNTSVIALLPIVAILFGGAFLLGAGTLKDLALALFVGIAVGTYSSICIATPVLAQLKEREPEMQALAKRVEARGGEYVSSSVGPALTPAAAGNRRSKGTSTTSSTPSDRSQPRRQPRSKRP